MRRSIHFTRSLAILRIQRNLERQSFPRFQMMLIVALTGGAGLLASYLLLRGGFDGMAIRYPLALAIAYIVFLFLLWLWIRTNAQDYADIPSLDGSTSALSRGSNLSEVSSGAGGDFGGGGASASFDDPIEPVGAASDANLLEPLGNAVGAAAEAEEFAIPLLALIFAAGLALASVYVIYAAPALFAELLLDGALSIVLYRQLCGDPQHWLQTAIKRTALPFALTALFLAGIGAGLSAYAPGARTLGDALHQNTK